MTTDTAPTTARPGGVRRVGPTDEGADWLPIPCNSCEGYLVGTEPGGICEQCLRDWETWHRNEREASGGSMRRWPMRGRGENNGKGHEADCPWVQARALVGEE